MSGVNLNLGANQTLAIILVAVGIVAVVAIIAWARAQARRRRTQELQRRFGPEYARTVNEFGDRTKAEAELEAREKRAKTFNLTPLSPADAARFGQAWNALQSRFVDDPKGAVVEADRLVQELMIKRGYPMADFERRAADISVDHPSVVSNYRAARAIALRDSRGEASTEELRKAVVHFRALFQELLEVAPAAPRPVAPPRRVSVSP
jgi:hypothetical protein